MKALPTRGQQRTAYKNWLALKSTGSIVNPDEFMWLIDWRKYHLPFCSLYIVTPDNLWPCKIGISVSPEKRVRSLQTSVWRPLSVAACFKCQNIQEAKALERKVHEALTDMERWLHGEWFDMRPDAAADIIRFSASVLGVECTDEIEDAAIRDEIERRVKDAALDNRVQTQRADARQAVDIWGGR